MQGCEIMLILTRRSNESFILTLSDDIDESTPIGDVLNQQIEITPLGIKGNQRESDENWDIST